MTKTNFAKKILSISPRYWDYVLNGQRNLSYSKAKTVSGLFGTSSDLWINPESVATERKAAWDSFKARMDK
jgi:plasmid maintenance system antidote protein VapI